VLGSEVLGQARAIAHRLGAGSVRSQTQAEGAEGEELFAAVRAKFLDQMYAPDRDTRFIVGSMLSHPASFLVVGLIWPKRATPTLF
jgi:hypothetical protein